MIDFILGQADAGGGSILTDDLMKILGWVTAFVGMVATSFIIPILKRTWTQRATSETKEAMMLGPQPFQVKMEEDFVTRREFEKHEQRMRDGFRDTDRRLEVGFTEMKGLFKQTMQEISNRDAATNEKVERRHEVMAENVEKVAQAAYAGREKVWGVVNEQREKLAAVEKSSDVVKHIDRLVDAIQPTLAPIPAEKSRSTRKS